MIEQLGSAEAVTAHMSAIGAKGGKVGRTGGFATYSPCSCKLIKGGHHVAQCAGLKGGMKSRRGPAKAVSDE